MEMPQMMELRLVVLEQAARIETLEAALREIADVKPAEGDWWKMQLIARYALAAEQDK
jgi:hypothetical protein